MKFPHIGKALAALSKLGKSGATTAEHVASELSRKTAHQVKAIDEALNFTLPFYKARTASTEELLENRRIAMLLARTIATPLPPRQPPGSTHDPQSWNDEVLTDYIGARKRQLMAARPTGAAGAYLSAGFWAYAGEPDRQQALAGWKEGKELCAAGLMAAVNASKARPTQTGEYKVMEAATDLVQLWFGADADRREVKRVLQQTMLGLNSNLLCLSYAGKIAPSLNLQEVGFAATSDPGLVQQSDGWGYVKQLQAANTVVLCRNYFDPAETSGPRAEQIVAIDDDMQVSRGGAVLHEATHLYGGTQDVQLNDAVYEKFGKAPPAQGASRAQGYGAITCLALANVDPEKAVKNADSYRMFCEAAKYFRRRPV